MITHLVLGEYATPQAYAVPIRFFQAGYRKRHDPLECAKQHWMTLFRMLAGGHNALRLGCSRKTLVAWYCEETWRDRCSAPNPTRLRRALEYAESIGLVVRGKSNCGYTTWQLTNAMQGVDK
jgi:hypothetical protein